MSDSAPAPWKAMKRRTRDGRVVVFVEDCEGGTVAVCDDYHRGDPQNYELGCAIAALPELLAICVKLKLKTIFNADHTYTGEWIEAKAELDAAITKTTGEQAS